MVRIKMPHDHVGHSAGWWERLEELRYGFESPGGGADGDDGKGEPRTSLDFGSSYFVIENVKLYLNAKHLTNTALKFTEGLAGRPFQREAYGQMWQFGIEATF